MIGVGVDIVNIARVERVFDHFGERFAQKILAPSELENASLNARFRAKRFAAQEAVATALGTGFRCGITMPSIRIEKSPLNQPQVVLSGAAKSRLVSIGGQEVLLSISDEIDSVVAFAVVR